MTTRTLYIIRHGQYDQTEKSRDGGSLTDLGRQQAASVGNAFKRITVDAVHASTMTRARETAGIITDAIGAQYELHDSIREAIPSIPPRIASEILQLMEDRPNFTHDTIHQDKKRVDSAFDQFFSPPDEGAKSTNELLVCHGNILRYFTCRALDVNIDTWAKFNINHCGITIITVDERGRRRLVTHNATGHIPMDMLTD
ncbi:MAG: histidine phosphatase family protein [Chloroflexota bacterium]